MLVYSEDVGMLVEYFKGVRETELGKFLERDIHELFSRCNSYWVLGILNSHRYVGVISRLGGVLFFDLDVVPFSDISLRGSEPSTFIIEGRSLLKELFNVSLNSSMNYFMVNFSLAADLFNLLRFLGDDYANVLCYDVMDLGRWVFFVSRKPIELLSRMHNVVIFLAKQGFRDIGVNIDNLYYRNTR